MPMDIGTRVALRIVSQESVIRGVLWTDNDGLANRSAEMLNEVKKVVEICLSGQIGWPEVELNGCVVEEVAGEFKVANEKGE
jgi:hypothetical protein